MKDLSWRELLPRRLPRLFPARRIGSPFRSGRGIRRLLPPSGRVLALLLVPGALLSACDDECCLSPSENEGPGVATVEVIPAYDSVRAGESLQMQAVPRDGEGNALSGRTVYWSSYTRYSTDLFPAWWILEPEDGIISSEILLSVDTLGSATGWAVGQYTVIARCEGTEGETTLTVTPLPLFLSSILAGGRPGHRDVGEPGHPNAGADGTALPVHPSGV